eukprot:scaffold51502_cov17-Tisochrysis_lutea.AAC.1
MRMREACPPFGSRLTLHLVERAVSVRTQIAVSARCRASHIHGQKFELDDFYIGVKLGRSLMLEGGDCREVYLTLCCKFPLHFCSRECLGQRGRSCQLDGNQTQGEDRPRHYLA